MAESLNFQPNNIEYSNEFNQQIETITQKIETALNSAESLPQKPYDSFLDGTTIVNLDDPFVAQNLKSRYGVNEDLVEFANIYNPEKTTRITWHPTNEPKLKLVKVQYIDGDPTTIEEKFAISQRYEELAA